MKKTLCIFIILSMCSVNLTACKVDEGSSSAKDKKIIENFEKYEYYSDLFVKAGDLLLFNENDIVKADDIFMKLNVVFGTKEKDADGYYGKVSNIKKEYGKYLLSDAGEYEIPKDEYRALIEKHFAVKIDEKESQYYQKETDAYRGHIKFWGYNPMNYYYRFDGNKLYLRYVVFTSEVEGIIGKQEICIENFEDENNFKILYCKKIIEIETTDNTNFDNEKEAYNPEIKMGKELVWSGFEKYNIKTANGKVQLIFTIWKGTSAQREFALIVGLTDKEWDEIKNISHYFQRDENGNVIVVTYANS